MAVEMADLIKDELDQHLDAVHFYSDSKVVLGYIYNESKRFYTYVHNRVQRIRQSSKPTQWHYVRTEENPADHASRSLTPSQLAKSTWLTGPSFIYHPPVENKTLREMFELVEPEKDLDEMTQARHVILKETQMATFEKELSALRANKPIPRQSPLLKLSPVLVNGLIAVGGRLEHSEVDNSEKNPIVIPKDSYISLLLTRHYHKQDKVHLTHEVLCTVMAEVTAIINARPLLPVSSDPENPFILSPSMLLTQKSCLPPPPGTFLDKDLYTKQWRQWKSAKSLQHLYSQAVSHPSTNQARPCLASEIGRDRAFSGWYGRKRSSPNLNVGAASNRFPPKRKGYIAYERHIIKSA
ncbi:hypothetical protein D4764_04G0015220 [Takifugu flavidus]|uniref:Uncharacterized protein n=1 Tax=Takifugu flavidus TaxID=433684 RepID=A0A5C6N6Z9_9TELE|nr:hypothetical protein D4764_04G0015220 [Takifugu flavidus]